MDYRQAIAGMSAEVYENLKRAVELAQTSQIDAIVTAPLNKEAMALAGYHFPGHTEILAEMTGKRAAMLLVTRKLRVVHVSTHVSLREAIELVTTERVLATMERNGVAYETELPLVAGPDLVEPVLSLLITDDHRWIAWTPQGYYDASPGAGDLVGFHVNRGVDRAAQFLPVHQFRQKLYRPDVINAVLATSDVGDAIAAAGGHGSLPPCFKVADIDVRIAHVGDAFPVRRELGVQEGTGAGRQLAGGAVRPIDRVQLAGEGQQQDLPVLGELVTGKAADADPHPLPARFLLRRELLFRPF